ncbi:MAG: TRAP transporter small permease [Hyphomicrobiaceae bacterium]
MTWLTATADRVYLALSVVSRAINAVGTLVVLGLVAAVNFDVIARGVFNAPFRGSVELVQFSIVLIVFLQLPDVVRSGKLTRSDGLLLLLGQSRPRLTGGIRRAINLLSAVLMLLIAITIWPEFVEDWKTNDFFGTPGIFTAPWWPVRLVIFLSATLCCVLWICKALGSEPEGRTDYAEKRVGI